MLTKNLTLKYLFIIALMAFSQAAVSGATRDMIYQKELKKLIPYKSCVTNAARKYRVPEWVLLAVLRHENGPINGFLVNPNGSKDYGVGCINDVRISDFHRDGLTMVTPKRLMEDPCFAIFATAYLLKKEYLKERRINGRPDENIWIIASSNYHYHYKGKKPALHETYKIEIKNTLSRFKSHIKSAKQAQIAKN